jgi:predicted metalloprotease
MRLEDQEASGNVEDRRGIGIGGVGGGLGIGGIAVAALAYFLGFDPMTAINIGQQVSHVQVNSRQEQQVKRGAPADERGQFVAKVLGSTEATWTDIFQQAGGQYRKPTLVLFEGQVRSACGIAGSAMGPFYCPGDQKLYIDLAFFRDLQQRFRAPGDFAQAYVIAHEVGHHVQRLTGAPQPRNNQESVRLELQADCYAGVWGYHAGVKNQLSAGDAEEALAAATAIGDDRLQQQAQGRVVPESFTHGSSAQRVRWFQRGLKSGNPKDCNTFAAAQL